MTKKEYISVAIDAYNKAVDAMNAANVNGSYERITYFAGQMRILGQALKMLSVEIDRENERGNKNA